MMLRASINHAGLVEADLAGIRGIGDSGLLHGAELVAFAEAAVAGIPDRLNRARNVLVAAAGHDVMIDTAAVVANFEMMTRIADTTGAAVNEAAKADTAEARAAVGVDAFESTRWG
jgi:hypothetical protein